MEREKEYLKYILWLNEMWNEFCIYMFPKDVASIRPKREVKFNLDLVPKLVLVLIVLYRMSLKKHDKLKYHLEELLHKNLIKPSVSP